MNAGDDGKEQFEDMKRKNSVGVMETVEMNNRLGGSDRNVFIDDEYISRTC